MIVTPDTIIIGGISQPGISVPGAIVIGGNASAGETLTIDMTAAELDPRITYTGPAHRYVDFEGVLQVAAKNEWPLSGGNLNVYGRHEPEPEATNYQGASQGEDISGPDYVSSVNTASTVIEGANGIGAMQLFDASRSKAALYDNGDAKWLVTEFEPSVALTRVTMSGTTSSDTTIRTYIARRDSANYCYALSQQVPAGDVTASFYRWVRSAGIAVGLIQVESGKLATSPIITEAGKSNTRPASSATVDVTGYKTLRMIFSNGDTETYRMSGDTFTIPTAKYNWGTRFISSIEIEK